MVERSYTDIPPLTEIERLYLERVFSMSGEERVARACDLYEFMKRMLQHQIRTMNPELDEREIRIRVAERFYMSDPGALKMLKAAREK